MQVCSSNNWNFHEWKDLGGTSIHVCRQVCCCLCSICKERSNLSQICILVAENAISSREMLRYLIQKKLLNNLGNFQTFEKKLPQQACGSFEMSLLSFNAHCSSSHCVYAHCSISHSVNSQCCSSHSVNTHCSSSLNISVL
jgi:hypothetical protein